MRHKDLNLIYIYIQRNKNEAQRFEPYIYIFIHRKGITK